MPLTDTEFILVIIISILGLVLMGVGAYLMISSKKISDPFNSSPESPSWDAEHCMSCKYFNDHQEGNGFCKILGIFTEESFSCSKYRILEE